MRAAYAVGDKPGSMERGRNDQENGAEACRECNRELGLGTMISHDDGDDDNEGGGGYMRRSVDCKPVFAMLYVGARGNDRDFARPCSPATMDRRRPIVFASAPGAWATCTCERVTPRRYACEDEANQSLSHDMLDSMVTTLVCPGRACQYPI